MGWTHIGDSIGLAGSPGFHAEGEKIFVGLCKVLVKRKTHSGSEMLI